MINENNSFENEAASLDPKTPLESKDQITDKNTELIFTLEDALKEMERIVNDKNAGEWSKKFNQLKENAKHQIHEAIEQAKKVYLETEAPLENFIYEHPLQAQLSALIHIFHEKQEEYQKNIGEQQAKNLEQRKEIIENLKKLYTNPDPGTNLFKGIREIKEQWSAAGQIPKNDFKIINNDYFHHLNLFYQMLDLNKEFLEQEYSHNLEKRKQIIARAKELENEPFAQKALNELQFLHKLWKEEAEPVAEEFRETTWEEFKEISNKIHDRKLEISAAQTEEQNNNLEKKNNIISQIKSLSVLPEKANHNHWQNALKKIEELRETFIKTGSVPKTISNQNWTDFKEALKEFNLKKNNYYKSLKNIQQDNLNEKLKIIQTAKDNQWSEDWDVAVALYKKLQEDWKNIGHVPRSMSNKIWEEFKEACNTFFNNFREKNGANEDNWKENYLLKQKLIEELKEITESQEGLSQIEDLKNRWNAIGKVPRDKMNIHTEFNKVLKEKLRLNKSSEYELNEKNLTESQLTDKARKIKNQISDLESEIVKLENNLSFFKNPSKENPLLAETYHKIEEKKNALNTLKSNLHRIISGE